MEKETTIESIKEEFKDESRDELLKKILTSREEYKRIRNELWEQQDLFHLYVIFTIWTVIFSFIFAQELYEELGIRFLGGGIAAAISIWIYRNIIKPIIERIRR